MDDPRLRHRRIVFGGTLGTALVGGWCFHDLALLVGSLEAHELPSLAPGFATALVAGAVAGAGLAAIGPRRWAFLGGAAVVMVEPTPVEGLGIAISLSAALATLPKAICGLVAAWCGLFEAHRRTRGVDGWAAVSAAVLIGGAMAGALLLLRAPRFAGDGFAGYRFAAIHVTFVLSGLVVVSAVWLRRARPFIGVSTAVVAVLISVATLWTRAVHQPEPPLRAPLPVVAPHPGNLPNLVLIVLDTVRAGDLAPYGYERVTTPRIDAFVRSQASRFTQSRSSSSWTVPSHASMFTGLLPSEHGAVLRAAEPGPDQAIPNEIEPLRSVFTTVAEILSERGYQTGGVVANAPMLGRGNGFAQGFQWYDDRDVSLFPAPSSLLVQMAGGWPHVGAEPYRDAREILRSASVWLDGRDSAGPFFLFVNLMDAHWPWIPRGPHAEAFGGERPAMPMHPPRYMYQALYDRKLRFLDDAVSRFLEELRARDNYDDTVVVITSDHGESFGEHGFWGHGLFLHEELILVPLYVKSVAQQRGTVVDTPIGSADLFGLMLDELGIEREPSKARGKPTAEVYPEAAFAAHGVSEPTVSWIDGTRKTIIDGRGIVRIHDVDTDPGERVNMARPGDREGVGLRRQLWLAEAGFPPWPEHSDSELTTEERRRLRALGYLDTR